MDGSGDLHEDGSGDLHEQYKDASVYEPSEVQT